MQYEKEKNCSNLHDNLCSLSVMLKVCFHELLMHIWIVGEQYFLTFHKGWFNVSSAKGDHTWSNELN